MLRYTTRARAGGTAMMETVMVLPLLLVILAFLIYFGRGMVRLQHAWVMDRYEAWRHAECAPGPAAGFDNAQLNQTFFAGKAQAIEYDLDGWFPGEAEQLLIDQAARLDQTAAELVSLVYDDLPAGSRVRFSTTHANSVRVWEAFEGPITHRHTRMNHNWRFANGWRLDDDGTWQPTGPNASNLTAVRDLFFEDFDAPLRNLSQQNALAAMLRGLYVNEPGYEGPTIEVNPN